MPAPDPSAELSERIDDLKADAASMLLASLVKLKGHLKIMTGFVQIFASLTTVFTVPWPLEFKSFLRWPTWSVLDIDLMGIFGGVSPCSFERPFLDMFIIHMCTLPAMILTAELARGTVLLFRYCSQRCRNRFEAKVANEKMGKMITFVIFFLYP